ncbi:MAG: class I SAM-dependent methyltransferase [Dehalococcoidales bacterium]|nr:MAG: class I SAM-dependent methyltransferase [Dehalococcoidales bacterium]
MSVKLDTGEKNPELISNRSFRFMTLSMRIHDFLSPFIEKRIRQFGIEKGMIVIDYGCGPGRYTTKLAECVGNKGKVYALDIHKLAIKTVRRKIKKYDLKNIEPILIDGYNSTLPDDTADVVCAIDMFSGIKKPNDLLKEIRRITKKDGILIIDGWHETRNHQLPSSVIQKILDSEIWEIIEETSDHLKCKPR